MNFQVKCYSLLDQSIQMTVYNNITQVSNNIMFYKNGTKYITFHHYCQKVIVEYLLDNGYIILINAINYQNKLEKYANYTLELKPKALLECL
jgi:hypothetical protein